MRQYELIVSLVDLKDISEQFPALNRAEIERFMDKKFRLTLDKAIRYENTDFYTRFECSFTSSPLVSSVVSHLLHSFRV